MSFDRFKFFQELHDIIKSYLTEKQIPFRNPDHSLVTFYVDLQNIDNAILDAELRGGFGVGVMLSIKTKEPSDLYICNAVTSWNVDAVNHEPFKLLEDKKLIHDVLDMIFSKANGWSETNDHP